MALILLASNDWLSATHTETWLQRILTAIFGPIPIAKLRLLHGVARKAGHVVSYFFLAWLSYRSARSTLQASRVWSGRAALHALGFSLATAVLDELRQLFTETRSGSPQDVALDMAGALLALAVLWMTSQSKGEGSRAPSQRTPQNKNAPENRVR
ncbi:MAG: VanZ family protein [Acidobacteria bacterium]|nr:VanZ family protein [Acidobacteriota bacterium]